MINIRIAVKARWLSARITSTVFFADQLNEENPGFTRWQLAKRNSLAAILFAYPGKMPITVKIEMRP